MNPIIDEAVDKLNQLSLENFEKAVAEHDLTYAYSDDHRVWQQGQMQMKNINYLKSLLPKEDVVRIWNKYVDQKIVEDSRESFYWRI